MEQHAHYYASQACGETDMRMSRYGAMAALGITRVGDDNGVVRQISMAGFRGFGDMGTAGRECDPKFYQAMKDDGGPGWSAYCECMFGLNTNEIKTCLNWNDSSWFTPPWSCEAKLWMAARGANPFRNRAEFDSCAAAEAADQAKRDELLGKIGTAVWEKREQIVQKAGEVTGINTGTGTGVVSTPGTGSSSLPGADTLTALIKRPDLRTIGTRFGPSVPSLTPAPKSNTALYVGLGVAGVAVLGAILLTRKRGA